jgi:hypothetical protein
MPHGAGGIPIGLDQFDVLPCGCAYEEARFEQWAVGMGVWTVTRASAPAGQTPKIAVSTGRSERLPPLTTSRQWVVTAGMQSWMHL